MVDTQNYTRVKNIISSTGFRGFFHIKGIMDISLETIFIRISNRFQRDFLRVVFFFTPLALSTATVKAAPKLSFVSSPL